MRDDAPNASGRERRDGQRINQHFSRLAARYKDLRTTDLEPVLLIKEKLAHLETMLAGDIGCGCGGYALKLFDELGDRLSLTCVDANRDMLKELLKSLRQRALAQFGVVIASSSALPLADNCLNAAFTFNAVHHFHVPSFLREARRCLKEHGDLFIYTRLRSHNRRSIWGRFFPAFYEKETRLYELSEFIHFFEIVSCLELESIERFKYRRVATLDWLTEQAKHHHYSTFELYEKEELSVALGKFRRNINQHFKDPNHIVWDDANTMFHLRKAPLGTTFTGSSRG